MGKTDAIVRDLGAGLGEEIGIRADAPGGQEPLPDIASTPMDPRQRLKGACTLPLEVVVANPKNPRTVHDAIADDHFIEEIRRRGIQSPPRVRRDEATGKFVILNGGRRLMAAQAIGLERLPVLVVDRDLTELEELEEMLAENLHRQNLDPIDEAASYRRFLDLADCTAKDLAERMRIDPGTISRKLALLKTDPAVQERISAGEISPKAGVEIAKIRDPEVQRGVAAAVIETRAPAAEVARKVRQRRGVQAKARSGPTVFKVARGIRVTVHATAALPGEKIVAALRTALGMALAEFEPAAPAEQAEQGAGEGQAEQAGRGDQG